MTFTGQAVKTAILLILGNVFIVLLAVRAVGAWARKEWGELVALVVGAVVVAGFIYFPDQIVNLLKTVYTQLTGS